MILYSRFLGQGLYQPGIVTATVEDLHELSQRVLVAQTLVEYAQEGIIDDFVVDFNLIEMLFLVLQFWNHFK